MTKNTHRVLLLLFAYALWALPLSAPFGLYALMLGKKTIAKNMTTITLLCPVLLIVSLPFAGEAGSNGGLATFAIIANGLLILCNLFLWASHAFYIPSWVDQELEKEGVPKDD
jgi:hypothetical protein